VPVEEALHRYAHWLVEASSSPGAIANNLLFYREGQRFAELGQIFFDSYAAMFLAPMEKYFTAQKKKGAYKNITALKLARLFCDMVLSELNNRLIVRHDMPDNKAIKRHIDAVVQIFLHGSV
jgi:hypothetical protein